MSEKLTQENLKAQTMPQLLETLKFQKENLLGFRQQKASSNVKPTDIRNTRKNIARVLGEIREKKLVEAIEKYKNAKILPKDLRPKHLTRAKRLELTRNQKRSQVRRRNIMDMKYKKVYYAYQP